MIESKAMHAFRSRKVRLVYGDTRHQTQLTIGEKNAILQPLLESCVRFIVKNSIPGISARTDR